MVTEALFPFPRWGDPKATVWDSTALCHLSPTIHYFCLKWFFRSGHSRYPSSFPASGPSLILSLGPLPASAPHLHLSGVGFVAGLEAEDVLPSHLPSARPGFGLR